MTSFTEYTRYDGLGLAELVRARQVTPLELVEAAIARIEAHNPTLNAVVLPMYEQARAAAAAMSPEGPFAGVPMLLKDFWSMYAGVPTSSGNRMLLRPRPMLWACSARRSAPMPMWPPGVCSSAPPAM